MKQAKKIFSESGKPMLSSRVAALRLGCAQDYIGKLCREGKLVGRQINGSWFVDELSVKSFELSRKEAKTARSKELSELRKSEQLTHTPSFLPKNIFRHISRQVAVVGIASLLIGAGVFSASAFFTKSSNPADAQAAALGQLQSPFFGTGGQVSIQDFGSAIAGFFGNLFGGSKKTQLADNAPAAQKDTTPVATAPEAATSSPVIAKSPSLPKTVSSATAPAPVQNVYPIRERVVERVVSEGGITQEALASQLQQLGNSLRSELYGSINGLSSVPPAQGGIGGAIAISQNISKLSNVTITNGTVNGLAGLTASDIPALSYFPATTSISTVYGGTGITSYTAGDILYANSAGTLSVLPVGSTGKVLKVSGGLPAWGTDTSGSGGSSAWATTTDNLAVYTSDTAQVVLIGASATTTTGNIFEVLGSSLFRGAVTTYNTLTAPNFTATSTTAKSTFPFASSTALTVSGTLYSGTASTTNLIATFASSTALTVSGTASTSKLYVDGLQACDTTTGKLLWSNGVFSCGTDFNNGVGGGSSFAWTPTTNYGALANSTSTPIWFTAGLQASSTSHFAAIDIATALGAASGGTGQNTYTTGDILYASGANTLAKLPVGSTGQVLKVSGGIPAWGADNTGGGGGSSIFATTTDDLAIYPSTVSSVLLLGASATTTTGNIFEVLGNTLLRGSIAVTGTASTSNLTVSNLPATLLSTNATGVAQTTTISAPLSFSGSTLSITQASLAANGYLSSADYTIFNNKISSSSLSQIFPFTPTTNYGAAANSTSTAIWFTAGLQASSTSRFVYASSTALTVSGTASTSKLYVDGLQACDTTTGKLLWSNGVFSCGTDFNNGVGGGSSFAWTPTTNYGALANSTSTPIWFTAGLQSSSTIQTTSINIDQNSGYKQAGVTILSASSTNLSTLVGIGAGSSLTPTGLRNTAIGYNALNAATTPDDLTAIGYQALANNVTGSNNSAIGSSALVANVSGSQNTAVGASALAANVTGASNTALGYNALTANTTGGRNSAFGAGALSTAAAASDNVAFGYNALNLNTTGTQNVAFGSGALSANTTGSNNVGVSYNALNLNTTGDYNIAFGSGALSANTTGSYNIAIGVNALQNNNGDENIAFGHSVLAANTNGTENSGFGGHALQSNTTGFQNSAFGYNALANNVTGTYNTALGFGALRFNNTASSNTAVGFQAGYGVSGITSSQNNVFLGYQAGVANTTGGSNTLLGYKSGVALTTGGNNIIIGDDASSANSLITGSNNILIGSGISATSSTSGNALIIGNLLYGIGFGTGSTPSTGVAGIATTSPFARFSVDSSLLAAGVPSFVVGSSTRTDLIVTQSGRVGIATTSPAATFSISGTSYTTGTAFLGGALTYGGVTLNNAVTGTGNMVLSVSPTFTGTAVFSDATFNSATTSALAVTGSSTISSVLNIGGQLNANLSALIASTTLTGNTLFGNATTSGSLAVNASTTIAGMLNALGGAMFGNATSSGSLTVNASSTVAGVLNIGGQFNANLSALIASTTLTGNTLFGNATSSGSLAINASTTVAGQFNAVAGASFGTASYTGAITSTATAANVFPFASSTALTVSGTGYFGAIGIGTSSPYAALSVAGQSVFNYITATGTTASTFTGAVFNSATSSAFAVTGSTTISSVLNIGGQLNANLSALIASTTLVGNTLLTNATTTNLYATAYFAGAGLESCTGNTAKLAWTNGQFSCGADMGSLGNDVNWTFFGNGGLRPATSTNQLLLGATATSSGVVPLAILNVIGGAGFDAATSTYLNVATFASTSALTVSNNALVYGNLGLGSTSPSARLSVFGGNIIQQATGTPVLATSTPASAAVTYGSAVSGNYVYIADGTAGLHIYDTSNPRKMTLVGTYVSGLSGALSVAVAGQYAYVGDTTAGLVILDVSNPSAPALVGSYAGGDAYGIALSGKYAYVSNFTGGKINIVDVSDPRAPFLVTAFSVGGNPYGLVARGRYLYIANQVTIYGFQILDISNPASPVIAGSYTGGLNPTGVYVSGKYAYVADASKGLLIVDVSNPINPTLTGAYEPTGQYYGVSVAGRYAYAADHAGLVKVIDISNPAAPYGAGILTLQSGLPNGITVVGKYAYVANNTSGLAVVDINGIESPSANIGSISANSVDVSDNLVVGGNISAGGGLNAGISGIFSRGIISAFIASTTQTNPVVATFIGGNVGIGTSTPYAALSVAGQSVFNYLTATGTTASTFMGATFVSATSSALAVTGSTTISSVLNALGGANFGTQTNTGLATLNGGWYSTASSTLSSSFFSTLNNYLASTTLAGNTLFGNATSSGSLAINASTTISSVLNALGGANFGTQTNTGLATLNGGFYSTASSTLSSSFFSTLNNYLASTTLAGSTLFGNATSSGSLAISASTTIAGVLNALGGANFGTQTNTGTITSTATASNVFPFASTTALSSSGSAYFAISGGRVGIGTSTPSTSLDVFGTDGIRIPVGTTAQRPSTAYTGQVRYNTTTRQFEGFSDSSVWQGLGGVIDVSGDTYIIAESSPGADDNTLHFYTGGVQRGVFASNGNFGIGTSSPLAQLTVATQNGADGSVTNLFLIASSTASATTTLFSVSNSGLTTLLNLSATSATTSALAVTASSTVGGALNIGGALSANLSAVIASTTLTGNTLFGNATSSGSLTVNASTTIIGQFNAVGGASFGTASYSGAITSTATSANTFPFASTTALSSFYASSTNLFAGVLGVGTSTVGSHTLNVGGNIGLGAGNYINWSEADGTTGYGFRDNGGTLEAKNSGGSWSPIGSGSQWTTTGDGGIYFSTAGTGAYIRNVSIGTTTTSGGVLTIASSTAVQLVLTDTTGGANLKHFYASTTQGSLAFGSLADNLSTKTEILRLNSTNKEVNPGSDISVRLGTTTARWSELNVGGYGNSVNFWQAIGDNYEKGSLGFATTTAGNPALTLATSQAGGGANRDIKIKAGTGSGLYVSATGQTGLGYESFDGSVGDALLVNGRIGIGTVSPQNKLQVNANGRDTGDLKYGMRIVNSDSASTQATGIALVGSSATGATWIVGTDLGAANATNFYIATSTSGADNGPTYAPFAITSDGGVKLSDSGTVTSGNKLYAQSGNLYWDGTQLNGAGLVNYWSQTGTTNHPSTFTNSVGVGTTTAWARLSVAGAAGGTAPLFAISSTTSGNATSTAFLVDSNGLVGIGTSTPGSVFAINNIANFTTGTSTLYNNLNVQGQLKVGTGSIYLNGAATSTFSAGIQTDALYATGRASTTNLTVSALTTSRIPYITTGGAFTDNSELTFDGTRLNATYASTTAISSSGSAYFATAGGNVGIGTTTPDANLTVYRGATGSALKLVGLAAGGTSDLQLDLNLLNSNSATYGRLGLQAVSGVLGSETGDFYISTVNSGTLSEKFRIKGTGNVGIGTTTPGTILTIDGTQAGVAQARISNYNTGTGALATFSAMNDSSGNGLFGVGGVGYTGISLLQDRAFIDANTSLGGIVLNNEGASPIIFSVSNAEKMRVHSDGNVGIGETAPGSKLSVSGGGSFGSGYDTTAAPTGGLIIEGNVGIGTTTPGYQLDINATAAGSLEGIRVADVSVGTSHIVPIEVVSSRADSNFSFGGRLAASMRRTDGTAIAGATSIGVLAFGGQWGTDTSFQSAKLLYPASIQGLAEGSFTSASAMPTALAFFTGSTGDALRSANLTYGTERMRITASGHVTPGADNTQTLGSSSLHWDCVYYDATSLGTCASDARLKSNIADLSFGSDPLGQLSGLRPRTFTFNDNPAQTTNYGFIAQEVQQVAPELVETGADGYLAVKYGYLSYITLAAVQQLNTKVDAILNGTATSTITNIAYANASTTNTDMLCIGGDCRTSWPNVATSTIDLSAYATNASVSALIASSTALATTLAAQGDTLQSQGVTLASLASTTQAALAATASAADLASTTDALYALASTTNAVLGGLTSQGSQTSGTSTPITGTMLALIDIPGLCVTGDTKLRRRRRKDGKTTDEGDGSTSLTVNDYVYDEVAIVDIKAGDEIASLDEKTGAIVYRRVKGLAFMGVKQTYRIITEDGRSIRTTANHPYLTRGGWKKVKYLSAGDEIAVSSAYDFENPAGNLSKNLWRESAQSVAYQPLVNRYDFAHEYDSFFAQAGALLFRAFYVVVASFGCRLGLRRERNQNDIVARAIKSIGGNNKSRPLFERAKVGKGEWNQNNVAPFIFGHTQSLSRYPRNQERTPRAANRRGLQPTGLSISAIAQAVGVGLRGLTVQSPALSGLSFAYAGSIAQTQKTGPEESVEAGLPEARFIPQEGLPLGALVARANTRRFGSQFEAALGMGCFSTIAQIMITENAALTSGAPLMSRAVQDCKTEPDTSVSIANRVFVSSSQNNSVHKAVEGLEPSRHEISGSILHRATAYGKSYHEESTGWAKIVSLEPVAQEDVYDIEVEGTHNFVGNGIVAHNTYLGSISTDFVSTSTLASTLSGYALRSDLESFTSRTVLDNATSSLFALIAAQGDTLASQGVTLAALSDINSLVANSTSSWQAAIAAIASSTPALQGVMTDSIIPSTDNTYAIGSATNRLSYIYANRVMAGDLGFSETANPAGLPAHTFTVGDMVVLKVSSTGVACTQHADSGTCTVPVDLGTALGAHNYGATALYFNTTGGVGVGVASSTGALRAQLDIRKASTGDTRLISLNNASATGNLYYQQYIGTGGELVFSSNDDSQGTRITNSRPVWNMTMAGVSDYFDISHAASGSGAFATTSTLRITNTGNIGIGTTTPGQLLSVAGDILGNRIIGSNFISTSTTSSTFPFASSTALTVSGTGYFGTASTSVLTVSTNATVGGTLSVTGATTLATSLSGLLQGASGVVSAITGTAGQFPYYNGTNTLLATSSVFLATSGNVGIGTASPQKKLELDGGSNTDTYLRIGSGTQSSAFTYDIGREASTGYLKLYGGQTGANGFIFTGVDGERMRIDTAGNVGIGTTSPQVKLEVNGDGRFDDSAGADSFIGMYSSGNPIGYLIGDVSNDNLVLRHDSVGGDNQLVLASTGNVGIGNTSPGAKLHVDDGTAASVSGAVLLRLESEYSATAGTGGIINFTDSSNNILGQIRSLAESSGNVGMSFGTYNSSFSEKVRINASGNVGIGTVSPAALLTVGALTETQAATNSGKLKINGPTDTSLESVGGIEMTNATDGYGVKIQNLSAGGANLVFAGRQNSTTWSEYMRIQANGNVGIGTTTPDTKLSVVGTGFAGISLGRRPDALEASTQLYFDSSTSGYLIRNDSGKLNFNSGSVVGSGLGTVRMVLDASGNVGIGTTVPESKTQITGGGLCVGSDANCNTDNNTEGTIYSSNTAMTVYDVAENYPTRDLGVGPADIVALDTELGVFVRKARSTSSGQATDRVLGVISEKPAVLLGGFNGAQFKEERQVAVGLSGRIPVKISLEGGDIAIGDQLSLSSTPGVAKKAADGEQTIGYALEGWNQETAQQAGNVGTGTVMFFIHNEVKAPAVKNLSVTEIVDGNLASASQALKNAVMGLGSVVVRAFNGAIYAASGIFDKVFAAEIHTDQLCLSDNSGETCVTKTQLDDLLNGQAASVATSGSDNGSTAGNIGTGPSLSVNGNNPSTIDVGAVYSDLGATITGPSDALNLGVYASVDGAATTSQSGVQIDTSAPGTHYVRYFAIDQNGLIGEATRTIIVGEGAVSLTHSTSTVIATSTPIITDTFATSTTTVIDTTASSTPTDTVSTDSNFGTGATTTATSTTP